RGRVGSIGRQLMLATIERLREIHRRCLAEQPLDEDQLCWLGQSLGAFLSHSCCSLDEALGLKFARGGVPWWLEEALRRRDAALRELAYRHLAQLSVTAQADRIHTLAIRYAATAWRGDKESTWMPGQYAETPKDGCGARSRRERRCRSASVNCAASCGGRRTRILPDFGGVSDRRSTIGRPLSADRRRAFRCDNGRGRRRP